MILIKVWKPNAKLLAMCAQDCHDAIGNDDSCVCGGYFRGASHRGGIDYVLRTFHDQVSLHLRTKYPGHTVFIRPSQLYLWQQLET